MKLLQGAHDNLKRRNEDRELVNRLQSTIRKYTLALDQHAVAELTVSNSEGNLVGPSQEGNEELLQNLDNAVEKVV